MVFSGVGNAEVFCHLVFLRIRRPPRSTQSRSSAASDVYKRQTYAAERLGPAIAGVPLVVAAAWWSGFYPIAWITPLSLIHISEPTRPS